MSVADISCAIISVVEIFTADMSVADRSFNINFPGVIDKFPILSPSASVVPNKKLSLLSSHPINALLLGSNGPRFINIPLSFVFSTVKFLFNTIKLSDMSKFVEFIVVAPPFIVIFPDTTMFPSIIWLFVLPPFFFK